MYTYVYVPFYSGASLLVSVLLAPHNALIVALIDIYIYIYVYIHMYYIYREREKERCIYTHVCRIRPVFKSSIGPDLCTGEKRG